MKFKYILLVTNLILLFSSCGGNKKAVATKDYRPMVKSEIKKEVTTVKKVDPIIKKQPNLKLSYATKVENYINDYSSIAMEEMEVHGIPASITLAQGILESGAGYGELTSRSKNHFGIKCHDWAGDKVYHDDDRSQECFRKYEEASQSFRDHSLFLKNRKRYAKLFTYRKNDYKSWAKGLKAAGYATDPKYPAKLIGIIERYDLDVYDREVLVPSRKAKIVVTEKPEKKMRVQVSTKRVTSVQQTIPAETNTSTFSNTEEHIVQKGDTLYSISKRYNIQVEVLKSLNGLADNTISIGQKLRLVPEEEF